MEPLACGNALTLAVPRCLCKRPNVHCNFCADLGTFVQRNRSFRAVVVVVNEFNESVSFHFVSKAEGYKEIRPLLQGLSKRCVALSSLVRNLLLLLHPDGEP